MAENADNDSLSPTRVARRAPSKRRASSASSDGESKLAGAAQSASESIPQSTPPFAHPGEPLRDESTLDLFAGDPLHAPVHAAQTDHRRGRLELQGPSTDEAAQAATTTEGTGPAVAVSHDGGQAEIVIDAVPRDGGVAREVAATPEAAATVCADVECTVAPTASQTPVLTEANAVAEGAATTEVDEAATDPMLPGQALAQMRAARAVAAPRPAKGGRAVSRAAADDASSAGPASASCSEASPESGRAASELRDAADFAHVAAPLPALPELNPAREQAFAEAIDALNGVIADQRRAARRMKWMLGAVVGALLVAVVAGAAQTMIVSRLAANVGDQQQRIAQMMQDQQAAIAGALARLPAQTQAPAGQVASQSPARPVAVSPAHHTQHTATHNRHARAAGQ